MQSNNTPFLKLRQIIGDKKKGILPIIPVSKTTWFRGIESGNYPKPIKLNERSIAWKRSDIEALIVKLGG